MSTAGRDEIALGVLLAAIRAGHLKMAIEVQ